MGIEKLNLAAVGFNDRIHQLVYNTELIAYICAERKNTRADDHDIRPAPKFQE